MKAIVLSDGELEVKEIENSLENLQKIVGGYIEMPYISKIFIQNGIDMVINEDGKFMDELKPQIAIIGKVNNQVLDIIYGNCIFVSHDDNGETVGLNDEQIKVVMNELELNVMLTHKDDENEEQIVVKAMLI